ncbi:hypothetical protein D3C81_2037110 [compost metagenome]
MKSISVTEPFSRLCSIEVRKLAGSPSAARHHAASGLVRLRRMPARSATAMASLTAALAVLSSRGSLYSWP